MKLNYEHNPNIMHIASRASGLPEDQILKVRETPDAGLVVIDMAGNKQTFTSAQLTEALAFFVNGRRNLAAPDPAYINLLNNIRGYRPPAGRKPKRAPRQPSRREQRGTASLSDTAQGTDQ